MDWLSAIQKSTEETSDTCCSEQHVIKDEKIEKFNIKESPIRERNTTKQTKLFFDDWEYYYYPELVVLFEILCSSSKRNGLILKGDYKTQRDLNKLLYSKSSQQTWSKYIHHSDEIELDYQNFIRKNE